MNITPDAQELWEGIAGHFDSLSQVISEFVDNSISNFDANKIQQKSIRINIERVKHNSHFQIILEDTGTGIKDIQSAFRLGDKTGRETPMNEHGFGLKHALASANPENNSWALYTRTQKQYNKGTYTVIKAPYSFDLSTEEMQVHDEKWPGNFNGSGTIIEFECSETFFQTLQEDIKGQASKLETILSYLAEDLGYTYSGIIEDARVNMVIVSANEGDIHIPVKAIEPDWAGYYNPKTGRKTMDLGGGKVNIQYAFGEMNDAGHKKYYKRNTSTSGVEVRVNGRVLLSNVFTDIWGLEPHPSYNHFLATIDIKADNRNALPKTRTSKNGVRFGDKKLNELYKWILKVHPKPHKKLSGAVSERELVAQLASDKETHTRSSDKSVLQEHPVFTQINSAVRVDLYFYDGTDVVLYEAKKDMADVQSVYQLVMYWDGAVRDGLDPDEGILIASSFSDGCKEVIEYFRDKTDANGNNYNLDMHTWQEENIQYPEE